MSDEQPVERCHLYERGEPRAKPMPDGRICGGMSGQPCRGCVLYGVGVRGMAEFFARVYGYEPRGRKP